MNLSQFVILFLLSAILNLSVVQTYKQQQPNNSKCEKSSCYKSSSPIQGPCPPAYIPFKNNGDVNYDVIPDVVNYLNNAGIKCIFVCADNTGSFALGVKQRINVVKAFLKVAKPCGITVIPEVGGQSIMDTLYMTREVTKIGVSTIAALPELYYVTNATEVNVDRLCAIGNNMQCENGKVLYYDRPKQTGVQERMASFWAIAAEQCPDRFGGVITFLHNALDIMASNQLTSQQSIFLYDFYYIGSAYGYCLNGTSDVIANIFPKVVIMMQKYIENGNNNQYVELQLRVNKFVGELLDIFNIGQTDATGLRLLLGPFRYLFAQVSGIANLGPPPPITIQRLTPQQKRRVDALAVRVKSYLESINAL